jgi:hypothetical protein
LIVWFGHSTLEDRGRRAVGVMLVRTQFRGVADSIPIHASYPTLLRLGVLNHAVDLQIVGVAILVGII